MYIEGKKKVRFLLSAKHFGSGSSSYLISSSEEFPELDSRPKRGYVARLDKQRDQSYSLILNHCHLCDNRLGFFCCGRGPHEREVVAKISHYFQRFQAINLDYKCIKVQIPSISKSGKRKIWCPRAFRNACPSLNNDVNVEMSIKDLDANSIFTFRNQVPEWNAELKSLVVRFQGNRVLIPSARNFLLCWGPDESERSYTTRSSSDSSSPVHSHHKQPTLIPHALMKEKDKDRDNTQQASTVVPSSNTSVGSSSHGRQRTASHRSDSFHSNGGGTPRGNVSQKRSATASSSAMSPKDGMAANARPRTNSTNSFQSLQQRMTSGSIGIAYGWKQSLLCALFISAVRLFCCRCAQRCHFAVWQMFSVSFHARFPLSVVPTAGLWYCTGQFRLWTTTQWLGASKGQLQRRSLRS